MTDFTGRTIHNYQVLLQIRETPTRVLYRAYDKKAHAFKALEIVKGAFIDPLELLGHLNKQSQLIANLTHPNIATVSDLGIFNGVVYLVYNFHPKYPLRRFFNRAYLWEQAARELAPIAHALMHAHGKGVIHGYLNPASIILDEKDNPILFDFGFEYIISEYLLAHSPGLWINQWGLMYRAPEQISGVGLDRRSDIYSFGMIIREWQTGHLNANISPLSSPGKTVKTATRKLRRQQPLPKWLQNFVHRCTALDPSKRYASMDEVFVVLANGALHKSITNRMIKKPLGTTPDRFAPGWTILILVIASLLVVSGTLLVNMSGILRTSDTSKSSPVPTTPVAAEGVPTFPIATSTLAPAVTEVPNPNENQRIVINLSYPVYQETPLAPLVSLTLAPENTGRMGLIGQWGMGILSRLVTSPDGFYIAAASSTGIFIFNAQTLNIEKHIVTNSWVSAIEFSPDGSLLASGDQDGLIQIWDTKEWTEAGSPYSGHTNAITDLTFSPDGKQLISVAHDHYFIRWIVHSPEKQDAVPLSPAGINAVAYSSDNRQILMGGDDFHVHVWDADQLERSRTITLSSKIMDIDAIPGTSQFVIGSSDNQVILLDLEQEFPVTQLGSLRYPLTSVAAAPGGNWFAAADLNGGVTVWGSEGSLAWTSSNFLPGSSAASSLPGNPHDLSFSPDGNSLFSGVYDGVVRVLSVTSRQEINRNQSLMGQMEKLVISDNTEYALTQDRNQTLTLWDLPNGRPLGQVHGEIKEGNPFSQDGRLIAVAANRTTVKVYDTNDLREIYNLSGLQDVRTIKFINDDAQLAAGHDKDMHLWSMSSGQELKIERIFPGTGCSTITDLNERSIFRITSYQHIVETGENLPGMCTFQELDWTTYIDNRLIAFGGSSKLSVINMQNTIGIPMDFDVNRRNVVQVAVNPAGNLLAAAFDDHVISLWDVSTGQELASLLGHRDLITDLNFTPDGTLLFSTSRDGTIRIWGIPSQEQR